jgi:hypothetical protein
MSVSEPVNYPLACLHFSFQNANTMNTVGWINNSSSDAERIYPTMGAAKRLGTSAPVCSILGNYTFAGTGCEQSQGHD